MKKISYLIALSFILISTLGQAQYISVQGGYNHANMSTLSDRGYDAISGYHIGLRYAHPIYNDLLFIESGAEYSTKGRVQNNSVAGMDLLSTKTTLSYIEVPVNLMVQTEIQPGVKLYAKGGPYIAGAVGGEKTRTSKILGNEFQMKEDINFGDNENDTSRWDYGLNLGAGVAISNVFVEVGLAHGLSDTSNKSDERMNHRIGKISVGYRF